LCIRFSSDLKFGAWLAMLHPFTMVSPAPVCRLSLCVPQAYVYEFSGPSHCKLAWSLPIRLLSRTGPGLPASLQGLLTPESPSAAEFHAFVPLPTLFFGFELDLNWLFLRFFLRDPTFDLRSPFRLAVSPTPPLPYRRTPSNNPVVSFCFGSNNGEKTARSCDSSSTSTFSFFAEAMSFPCPSEMKRLKRV